MEGFFCPRGFCPEGVLSAHQPGYTVRVNRIYCIIDTAPIIGASAISQGAMSTIAGCAEAWFLVESINIHRRLCSDRS